MREARHKGHRPLSHLPQEQDQQRQHQQPSQHRQEDDPPGHSRRPHHCRVQVYLHWDLGSKGLRHQGLQQRREEIPTPTPTPTPALQLTTVEASLSSRFLMEDFTVMLARTITSRDFMAEYS